LVFGSWSSQEQCLHINCLEMMTVSLASRIPWPMNGPAHACMPFLQNPIFPAPLGHQTVLLVAPLWRNPHS
ncbi:hypothetical protein M9458_030604, partial [Cirrhinus mrigala]